MDRKLKVSLIGGGVVTAIVLIILCAYFIKASLPSKAILPLEEYYTSEEGKASVILQDELYEKKALMIDGYVYMDYESIANLFNQRFYWDKNENILTYATPTELIRAEVGSDGYLINKSKKSTPYAVVKTSGDNVYIALDFVQLYSGMTYVLYDNPDRVVIQYKWGERSYTSVKKPADIRLEANIKSPIVEHVGKDAKLLIVASEEKISKKFTKVVTEDGVIGYVQNKFLGGVSTETVESQYKEPEYTHISKDYKINMIWHQVTNASANNNLLTLLSNTKGVNTVSPTWFSVNSNKGTISSLASQDYVNTAHNNGVEVWALVDDFAADVSLYEVMSHTSTREQLVNSLVAEVIKYNIDGINIDFEHITNESAPHYLQFIRELSIKCRSNGIVLSIDNYVPAPYNAFYNRKEQGIVADYVVIMGYDEHHATSETSGSVSSIKYFTDGLNDTIKDVSPDQVIMGMPFYTRVWEESTKDGETKVKSTAYTMQSAWNYMTDNGATPVWDSEIGQYYAEFSADDVVYKCWLEEETSIEERMKVISNAEIAGVAAWRLGFEKAEVWNVIIKYVN